MHTDDRSGRAGRDPSPVPLSEDAAEVLMAAYAAGDRRAWEALFDELAPRLLGFFECVSQDLAAAEELVEATFVQLHRVRRTYRCDMSVRRWVFGIAARVQRERGGGLDRRVPLGPPRGAAEGPPAGGARALHVRQAIGDLAPVERVIIRLHRVERMSFEEIAEVLGFPEEVVRCHGFHAYRALRERLWALSEDGEGP